MQKISKKWSILLWAIFLSLIISISFLSISTKITKKLKESNTINTDLEEQNNIYKTLKTSQNNIEKIWNKTIYIENKSLEKSLKKDETYSIHFPLESNINLELTSSWVIKYEYDSTSWILNNADSNLVITINSNSNLLLTNYSWFASYKLESDNKFEITEKKYKIIEKIWNKNIIKSSFIIK